MTASFPPFPVLIDRERLLARITQMAEAADRAYGDREAVVFINVIEGARVFCGELLQRLSFHPEVIEIRAKSYLAGTTRDGGEVAISGHGDHRFEGKTVVIVEDIVDTGHTVHQLGRLLRDQGAADVEVITLLTKPVRREVDVALDHVGFEVEDHFVIGFGMDVEERYRDLPEIVIYDPALDPPFPL